MAFNLLLRLFNTPLIFLTIFCLPFPTVSPRSPSQALRQAGFTTFADSLLISNLLDLPPNFTLFAPPNSALLHRPLDPLSLRYHIASRRFSYQDLTALPLHTRIDTLLPGQRIVVTALENALLDRLFTVDGVPLLAPDLFVDSQVAAHGVNAVLDYFSYGAEDIPLPQDRPPPARNHPPPSVISNSSIMPPATTLSNSSAAHLNGIFTVNLARGGLLSGLTFVLTTFWTL